MKLKGVTADIFFDKQGYNGNIKFDISAVDKSINETPKVVTMATWKPSTGLNLTGKHLMPNSSADFEYRMIKIGSIDVSHFNVSHAVAIYNFHRSNILT